MLSQHRPFFIPMTERLITALATAAEAWQEPEHPARAEAQVRTLAAPNRFTAEALTFALNHFMHALTPEALRAWHISPAGPEKQIGIRHESTTPLQGWPEALAVLLAGHHYLGTLSEASPALLPAFFEEVRAVYPELRVGFVEEEALCHTDGVISWDEVPCKNEGVPTLVIPERFTVAVLDGKETLEERGGLAEDCLLYEGEGPASVRIMFAPRGLSPDPLLDVFQQFRETFPAHPATNGALALPRGFLSATKQPHAWGEGFLISKGEPSPQRPGHFRWAEYDTLEEVETWLHEHEAELFQVVTTSRVAGKLAVPHAVSPGEAHRQGVEVGVKEAHSFLETFRS